MEQTSSRLATSRGAPTWHSHHSCINRWPSVEILRKFSLWVQVGSCSFSQITKTHRFASINTDDLVGQGAVIQLQLMYGTREQGGL